ncbi:MAG: glycosyltransferase [Planctomycetes bacterium]|nr:glycosyltransferase [Planctomycetota bacterium]
MVPPPTWVKRDPDARVLVFSLRNLVRVPSRGCNAELEDVTAAVERADVIAPLRPGGPPRLVQKALWGKLGRALPAVRRLGALAAAPVDRDYDLLFVSCQNPQDLYLLGPLAPWRARCRRTAVYVDELWAHTIPDRAGELALLAQFDHVFIGQEQTSPPLSAALGRPAPYLPIGLDTLRFCPYPDPPARAVDVFNMGRRSAVTHEALKALARERGLLYLFDTMDGRASIYDFRDHRDQLAGLIQRSRYFVTNVAKVTSPEDTGGQQEVGFRFFEGAAGGAVMIGEAPRCASFDEHFGWEDAVVPMPYGTADPAAVLDALDADPERVEAIRRRNVASSLRRHDWAYRWARVLDAAGLQPSPKLAARRERLARLADEVDGGASKNGETPPARLRAA